MPESSSRLPELRHSEQRRMERRHILVVSSAVEFVGLLRELLLDERYNVTTTNFVARTFQQIEALEPDLLMIDLIVQQQAGWSLLRQLQETAAVRDVPVIVTSTDHQLLEQAEQGRGDFPASTRYVVQPFDIEQLLESVDTLIGAA